AKHRLCRRRAPFRRTLLIDVWEVVSAALLGRRSDDEEDDVIVAVVPKLAHGGRLKDADASSWQVEPLRRIADVDRGVPLEHNDQLFLDVLGVALAARPGWIPPELCGRLAQRVVYAHQRAPAAVAAVHELELAGQEDRVGQRSSGAIVRPRFLRLCQ